MELKCQSCWCNLITFMIRQKENANLHDHTKKFKTPNDIFMSHISGPIDLTKNRKGMTGYGIWSWINWNMQKQGILTITYFFGSWECGQNYGSMIKGLQTLQLPGKHLYPTTIADANNVTSKCKFDNRNVSVVAVEIRDISRQHTVTTITKRRTGN